MTFSLSAAIAPNKTSTKSIIDTFFAIGSNFVAIADKNSNLPDYIPELENKNIDLAMTGEGEYSMLELINALANKNDILELS